MAARTPTQSIPRTPPGGAAPLAGVFLILWIAFAVALVFSPETLDSVWDWLGTLPLVGQVILWVLFLPLVVGLWIWHADWPLWVRLILIAMVAIGNIAAFSPRSSVHRVGGAGGGNGDGDGGRTSGPVGE
jgi:hypothetical protein